MDHREFEDCLDRYGGDLTTWPVEMRARAEALIAGSAAARRSHDDVCAFEAILRATVPRSSLTPPTLFPRVTNRPQARRANPVAVRAGLACVFASVLVLGFVTGGRLSAASDNPDHVIQAVFSTAEMLDVD